MALGRVTLMSGATPCGFVARAQERLGIGAESRLAPAAAEQVGRALVVVREPGLVRIHGHTADRIACFHCHGFPVTEYSGEPAGGGMWTESLPAHKPPEAFRRPITDLPAG